MHIDPFLFTGDAISDETRRFNAELQAELLAAAKTSAQTPRQVREARLRGRGPWGPIVHSSRARTVTIDGPGGDLDLRVIDADDPTGLYVHIHGGGWVLGAADQADVKNEEMARAANVTTVSIDYRLAPEHPFPAGVEDCIAATTWIINNALAEFGTDTLTIGGESAGANLAAATMLTVRDRSGFTRWRAANLVYGVFMPRRSPSAHAWTTDGLILDADTMQWFEAHYLDGTDHDLDDPRLSPLYGDLSDMPPALFTVGTLDPLLDDTLFMAMRWEAAGNRAEVRVHPGGVHAFDGFPTTLGTEARDAMHRFIGAAVE